MGYNNAKGAQWERQVATWLNAERRAPFGMGDIAELGKSVIVECKAQNTYAFSTWMTQLHSDMRRVETRYDIPQLGLLAAKRIGSTNPEHAYWLISPSNVRRVIQLWQQAV